MHARGRSCLPFNTLHPSHTVWRYALHDPAHVTGPHTLPATRPRPARRWRSRACKRKWTPRIAHCAPPRPGPTTSPLYSANATRASRSCAGRETLQPARDLPHAIRCSLHAIPHTRGPARDTAHARPRTRSRTREAPHAIPHTQGPAHYSAAAAAAAPPPPCPPQTVAPPAPIDAAPTRGGARPRNRLPLSTAIWLCSLFRSLCPSLPFTRVLIASRSCCAHAARPAWPRRRLPRWRRCERRRRRRRTQPN